MRSQSSERSRTRHKHKHKDRKKKKEDKRRRSPSSSKDKYRKQRKHQVYKRKEKYFERKDAYSKKSEEDGWIQNQKQQQITKQQPCWQPSGILLQFYNSREGISLKFHEPPESRPPTDVWRVYIFKGEEVFQPVLLNNSCYLFGKDERVCDILCQNQSVSRQHAVIQFRLTSKQNQDGSFSQQIKPYLMDLDSTNGTFLNGQKIESSRYIQLLEKDVLRFGFSERDYVMVREDVKLRSRHDEE